MKQILFAHSAGEQGGSGQGSFDLVSYLRKELSDKYEINYPLLKNPEEPTYEMWKNLFSREFNKIGKSIILIGHSLGGSTLLKYLSEEKPAIPVSALFLVSIPHWGENGWNVKDFEMIKNFETELKNVTRIYLYHSNNDPIVPIEHLNFYQSAFPDAITRVIKGTDHAFANGLSELVSDIKSLE